VERAVKLVPGWPQQPLPGDKDAPVHLQMDEFPESLRKDLEAYLRREARQISQVRRHSTYFVPAPFCRLE